MRAASRAMLVLICMLTITQTLHSASARSDGDPLLDQASLTDFVPEPFVDDSPGGMPHGRQDPDFPTSWYQATHNETGVIDPLSGTWITDLRNNNDGNDFLLVGNVGSDGLAADGTPFYRVPVGAPDLRIEVDCFTDFDPSTACDFPDDPKIPIASCQNGGAQCFKLNLGPLWVPPDTDQAPMVVFDRNTYGDGDGNYAVWLWRACPPNFVSTYCLDGRPHLGQWSAKAASVSYLASNGLPGCWPDFYSSAPSAPWIGLNGEGHNDGHFGVPAPYQAMRYNEVVMAGQHVPVTAVPHMLKVFLPSAITTSQKYFPSTSADGSASDVPIGTVMRIRPSLTLTLSMFGGNKYALAIGLTLQRYGAIVGDTNGNVATVSSENLITEGSINTWAQLGINVLSLNGVPLTDYQFLYRGYGGPSVDDYAQGGSKCEDLPIR